MRNRFQTRKTIAILAMALFGLGAILSLTPGGSPPSVAVALLGYTNRVGRYALLAITNREVSAPLENVAYFRQRMVCLPSLTRWAARREDRGRSPAAAHPQPR